MKNYKIYSARLQYSQSVKLLGEITADSLEEVKEIIGKPISEGGLFKNPAYTVIVLDDEVVYNLHLPIK